MKVGSSLVRWIDGDWQKRRYLPVFAVAQRLLWIAPILIVIAAIKTFGLNDSNSATLWLVRAGIVSSLFLFCLPMYRWLIGFGKTGQMKSRFDQLPSGSRNG